MNRLRTTLCALVLATNIVAQRPANETVPPAPPDILVMPVTEGYRDFSDWKHVDSTSIARFHAMRDYVLPSSRQFVDEVASAMFYLDAVKVPDWSRILSPKDTPRTSPGPLVFSGDSSVHLPNRFLDDAAYFFFLNGSDELFRNDTADIKTLMEYHLQLRERGMWSGLSPYDTTLRFTVEAHANSKPFKGYDQATSDQKNYMLSGMRGLGVASVMHMLYPLAEIEIRAFGNSKPLRNDEEEDRVVRVIPGKTAMECALEQIPADYTILDGSYSMKRDNGHKYSPLEIVKLYPYENGNVFFFSDRGAKHDGTYNHPNKDDLPVLLTKYAPAYEARTPLKEVMLYLALVADPGTSFRFITDGVPSQSLVQFEHVIKVAQRRDITFSFIGTEGYNRHLEQLKKVADATGGQTYFACDPQGSVQLYKAK